MTITATATVPATRINGAVPSVAPTPHKATPARKTPATRKRPVPVAKREAHTRAIMRWVAIIGGTPVLIIAMIQSYCHISTLAMINGQSATLGHMTPISIDGLMIVAAVAIIAQRTAWIPRVSFGVGALLTLGANALSIHPVSVWWIALILAATPAVALLASAEMLLRLCLPQPPKRRTPARKPATKRTK